MALLLPSLQGGLSATKSATTFDYVIKTEVMYAALRTVFKGNGSSFLHFFLLVEIRPAMPSSKKKAERVPKRRQNRAEGAGVLTLKYHNQPQISFIERNTMDKPPLSEGVLTHSQHHSCLVWVCLHSLGCCENMVHQWIITMFNSLSWKTEVQDGCHKAKWFLRFWQNWGCQKTLGKNISLPCPARKATGTPQLVGLLPHLQTQHQRLQSFSNGPLFCSSAYRVDAFPMNLVPPRPFHLPPHFKVSW